MLKLVGLTNSKRKGLSSQKSTTLYKRPRAITITSIADRVSTRVGVNILSYLLVEQK